MATGLLALLDDVAGIAKVAAASIDDIAAHAGRASAKAAGVVIDDAAVTPRYLVGFAAERELPIIGRIAAGSLKNKLLYLLPAALILSLFAPWAITPLLVIGGAYLCYEGTEKVYEALWPHHAHHHEAAIGIAKPDPQALEDEKVRGAIATDFILSAEIMAIALASLPADSIWLQAFVLAAVGVGITVLVYGAVALIVKADDLGVAMVRSDGAGSPLQSVSNAIGRALVYGMPIFLKFLSIVGTAAMIWVGGGIILHGLEEFGLAALPNLVHDAAEAVGHALPGLGAVAEWIVTAAASGLFGLVVGAALIPLVQYVGAPLWRKLRGSAGRDAQHAS